MTEDYGRAIGRIEGKLDRLIGDMAAAGKAQAQFHAAMADIKNRQDNEREKMEAVLARLQKIEEPLIKLARWRERFIGAAAAASFAVASLGGVMAPFWQKLAASMKMWI